MYMRKCEEVFRVTIRGSSLRTSPDQKVRKLFRVGLMAQPTSPFSRTVSD